MRRRAASRSSRALQERLGLAGQLAVRGGAHREGAGEPVQLHEALAEQLVVRVLLEGAAVGGRGPHIVPEEEEALALGDGGGGALGDVLGDGDGTGAQGLERLQLLGLERLAQVGQLEGEGLVPGEGPTERLVEAQGLTQLSAAQGAFGMGDHFGAGFGVHLGRKVTVRGVEVTPGLGVPAQNVGWMFTRSRSPGCPLAPGAGGRGSA